MGSDNLFHKRKSRQLKDYRRKKSIREQYARVLIVTEGEKTEPQYFDGLKDFYGLSGANIEICGECGSDPQSIFKFAQKRYKEERDFGDPFDRVYCVFDKDGHTTYTQALDSIKRATPKETFFAITSVPCFEYWLLLHFKYTTRPYENTQNKSAAGQVLSELKKEIYDYDKGKCAEIFRALSDKLGTALYNAERAQAEAKDNNTDNPSTDIHLLVDYLMQIKK